MEESKKEYIVYLTSAELIKTMRIAPKKEFSSIGACLVNLSKEEYTRLKKRTQNIFLASEHEIKTQIKEAKKLINVSRFYSNGYFGNGITVAIIDTGVQPLLDFCVPINRLKVFKDFTNSQKVNPYDDNGHGTFVAGVVGGSGLLSFGEYSGIAPLCDLIMLKALNHKGEGYSPTIIEAMNWIIENKTKYSIKVVCLSFGSEALPVNDSLSLGAKKLWENGIVVVTAGGNSGPGFGSITSPGICSQIITVGALDSLMGKLKVADFSSRGNFHAKILKPDILAPGTGIISNSHKIGIENYVQMSGTSVSAPIIAGICALFCEKYPTFTPNQIKSKLFRFAVDIGEPKTAQGRGVFIYK